MSDADRRLRCGLVGPGRTRNGLGPFLAGFAEKAGFEVVAAAGRDPERTAQACVELGERLGHEVASETSVEALCQEHALDALIIAPPAVAHLPALRAAAAAGLHVLCEKPLVAPGEEHEVDGLVTAFRDMDRVLLENAQWPMTLPVFGEFGVDPKPRTNPTEPRQIAMGLSPAEPGLRLVDDSLSHLLSVAQAVCTLDPSTRIVSAEYSDRSEQAESTVLTARLQGESDAADLRFELARVPTQPRPAWIELDGVRVDRRIDTSKGYQICLEGPDGIVRPVGDPMEALVYRFAQLCRAPRDSEADHEAVRIRVRARLYSDLLSRFQVVAG